MGFSMDIPEMDKIKEEVVAELVPVPEVKTELQMIAEKNVDALIALDINSLEERKSVITTIDSFGNDIVQKSKTKNELLEVSMGELSKMGGEDGVVVKSLGDLNKEMKRLDPSYVDFNKKGLLGKLFNPVKEYFEKYEKADKVIDNIMVSLESGKKTLKNDNTTLEIEQASLRDLTLKLNKQVELGTQMDVALETAIEKAKATNMDPEKIKFIQEEIQFPLRQKVMDLQQMQVVNQQGIFAMEVIRRNNKELIRAVERSQNVTVSALRVAVMVASALYNQKIVLEKVKMVNETTNNILTSTSRMLKEQGVEIQKQSMEENISVETLKEAFANTFEALDAISEYKQNALPQMKTIIEEFKEMANDGERRIQQMEKTYLPEL